jgi:hypothetical protein
MAEKGGLFLSGIRDSYIETVQPASSIKIKEKKTDRCGQIKRYFLKRLIFWWGIC